MDLIRNISISNTDLAKVLDLAKSLNINTKDALKIFTFINMSVKYLNWWNNDEFTGSVGIDRSKVYGQFFKEKWKDPEIHFEWGDLFSNTNSNNSFCQKFVIHMEKKTILTKSKGISLTRDELRKNIQKKFLPQGNQATATSKVLWSSKCSLNALTKMNDGEMRIFIEDEYKEVENLSKIIDEFLK
ncbi:MAG: hypothetical protein LBC07_03255 [Elusimicrobiota bacterium]|jgi:hypothetical protein|nr:hypothetical protein [Elusimicrobiota bacterium]